MVAQGPVMGALLWNKMYDEVIRVQFSEGCRIMGFADDLTLIVACKQIKKLKSAAISAIRNVVNWMHVTSRELASHKTEAVLITSRKIIEYRIKGFH